MNRKEAHLTQGKTVVFTEQNPKCSYYGVLQHIETPKKQNLDWKNCRTRRL